MFLTNVVIAGGALITGAKVYRENQRKKKTPWTVYAEKIAKNDKKKRGLIVRGGLSEITNGKVVVQKFKKEKIRAWLPAFGRQSDTRSQQLLEINKNRPENEISEAALPSEEEKDINRRFAIASGSLGLTIVGSLLYPPLNLLSVPGLVYLCIPFMKSGVDEIFKEKRIGIGTVDAVIVSSQLIYGYFFALSLFASLFHYSQKLLLKTRDTSRQQLVSIFGEQPRYAWVEQDGIEVQVPIEALQVGDLVVVHAGETIPIDGEIIDGVASIDQRILTGEAQPAEKSIGESVFAATVVLSGKVVLSVNKAGSETVASQVVDILNRTADFKSSVESQGEIIADKSAWPMLALSTFSFFVWGPARAISALKCYFGYNLRIFAPLSVLNFLNMASQHHILIKDGRALELLRDVDTVVFDKTGTLTEEQPHVAKIYTYNNYTEDDVLSYAAAAEYKQTHPIARAILQKAQARQLELAPIDNATYEIGYGLKVYIEGKMVRVGSARFMEIEGIVLPSEVSQLQEEAHEQGHSLVYIAIDDQLDGVIELHATIRPEAKRIIRSLQEREKTIYIISGDHEKPTRRLAKTLGIDHYFAETLPENKADLIEQLQKAGHSVCFVGDGINDSIALKKANVSISLQGASTIATDTAQIILMDESLNHLPQLFDIAQDLKTNMQQNLLISILLGLFGLGGVFLLNLGVNATTIWYRIGMLVGVANAMRPTMNENGHSQLSSSVPSDPHHSAVESDAQDASRNLLISEGSVL